jgi:Arf-GAP domain and FG repeats-containing protein 1
LQRNESAGIVDFTSINPGKSSLSDLIFEDDNVHRTQKSTNSVPSSFVAFSDTISAANGDISKTTATQQHPVNSSDQSVDLFANMTPVALPADKISSEAPEIDNAGWATFDTRPQEKQPSVIEFSGVAGMRKDKQDISHDLFSFEPNDQPTWLQVSKNDASVTNQSSTTSLGTRNSQVTSIFVALVNLFVNHMCVQKNAVCYVSMVSACNAEICNNVEAAVFGRSWNFVPFSKKN